MSVKMKGQTPFDFHPFHSGFVRCGSCAVLSTVIWLSASLHLVASEQISEKETRDIVELLVSQDPSEEKVGERLLAAQRSIVIETLLRRIRRGGLETKWRASYQLGLMISPWMRGKEAGARSYGATEFSVPRRQVEKHPEIAEGSAIRSVLQQAITELLIHPPSDSKQAALEVAALIALRKTLVEVANDDTMDWLVDLLSRIKSPEQTEFLIELV